MPLFPRTKMFSISCRFLETLAKSYVGASPTWRVAPSTPRRILDWSLKKRTFTTVQIDFIFSDSRWSIKHFWLQIVSGVVRFTRHGILLATEQSDVQGIWHHSALYVPELGSWPCDRETHDSIQGICKPAQQLAGNVVSRRTLWLHSWGIDTLGWYSFFKLCHHSNQVR